MRVYLKGDYKNGDAYFETFKDVIEMARVIENILTTPDHEIMPDTLQIDTTEYNQ